MPKLPDNWWENKNNFPCMIITYTGSGPALVWVHYQLDGVAYDVRDSPYRLVNNSNWRRASKKRNF